MPGSVDTPLVPGGGFDVMAAEAKLADVQDIASNIEDKIQTGIISNLADAEAVCSRIQGAFLGTAGVTADDIDRICQKIMEKIQRGMTAKMTDVYGYMVAAGFPVPTMEQVKYANTTGDYIGSMVSPETLPTALGTDTLVAAGPDIGPIPVNPQSAPTAGGFQGLPITGLLVGAVIPPPPNAPPALGPGGYGTCPAGWIAASPRPGYAPYCYPGPLMSVINPTEPNAPYGYDPMGSGSPLCQDGSVQPFSGYCSPTVPGNGPPSVGSEGEIDFGGGSACPPGQVPGPPAPGPLALTDIDRIVQRETTQTQTGEYCQVPARFISGEFGQPGQMASLGGVPTYAAAPYMNENEVPTPQSDWDVVTIHHWAGGRADAGWQDFPVVVPHGYSVFIVPETGILYAAQSIPPFGCPVGESRRQTWVPGVGTATCVPATTTTPDHCGPPPPVDCPEPYKAPTLPESSGDNPCDQIKSAIDKLGTSSPKIGDIITFLGDVSGAQNPITGYIIKAITGSDQAIIPALVKRFADYVQKVVGDASKGLDCDRAKLLPLAINRAAFEFLDKWTGIIPDQLRNELRQLSNTVCQSELPSSNEADRAWLKDSITDDEWECFTKADGKFIQPAKKIRDGERSRATIHEVFQLLMREKLDDGEAGKKLRALGVTDQSDYQDFANLMEQFPTFSDLIRFMVRDVFNEQTVTDAGLDQGFEANYTEQARKYGKAAGVPDDIARYFWRAHWQIPSYTMLREMLFRLRPSEYGPDMAVTQDVMRKALEQDDWAPGFVKRMIEISYHTITRTDSILMYMMHTIDDETFVGYLMSDGYKEKDARTLQEHYKVKRRIADYLKAGYPTLKQAVTLYARCQIDPETLNDVISKLATSDDQATAALEAADVARAVWERKQAVSTIQREFRLGLLSDTEATSELQSRGVDATCIPGLVRAMRKNRQRASKYLSASQLCKMRKYGLVTDQIQLEALMRQGWDTGDAIRIVAQCDRELADGAAKELAKQATAAAKQSAAESKAAAKATKAKKS